MGFEPSSHPRPADVFPVGLAEPTEDSILLNGEPQIQVSFRSVFTFCSVVGRSHPVPLTFRTLYPGLLTVLLGFVASADDNYFGLRSPSPALAGENHFVGLRSPLLASSGENRAHSN